MPSDTPPQASAPSAGVTYPSGADQILDEVKARLINIERKINMLMRQELPLDGVLATTLDDRDQLYGGRTYAQHGDDLILLNIFRMIGIDKPSYIDVGAHDPIKISNTALLYTRGSRGINVEANPLQMKAFHTQRPEDINLNVGVGDRPGELTLYMFDDHSGLNTLDPERVKEMEKTGKFEIKQKIKVPVVTIENILNEYRKGIFPDLLSLDIEGLDIPVLRSIDYTKSKPKVICVEGNHVEERRIIKDLLENKGYELYCRAISNLFFVDQESMKKIKE